MQVRCGRETAGRQAARGGEGRARPVLLQFLSFLRDVVRDAFVASLFVYLVLVVVERLDKGFASAFFNLNVLLGVVVVTGALTILTCGMTRERGMVERVSMPGPIPTLGAAALGALGAVLIYAATMASGWTALVSSLGGGCAIGILAWLLVGGGGPGGRKGQGE